VFLSAEVDEIGNVPHYVPHYEWVTVRRVRVKDAVDCVWWLSPTPWPKASNRSVPAASSSPVRKLVA
jgi:hypothetical protein